jgi:hypothetical protein
MKKLSHFTLILITVLESINLTFGQQGCPGFRTQTQGGWGSTPNGNNPGMYLQNNFNAAFPQGITIGCNRTLKFTSALAIRNFLPQGSSPAALTASFVNPTKTQVNNVLAGQVLALAISLGFDQHFPNFGSNPILLKDLIIASGSFQGWTVQQLFNEANKKLGGCASPYSFSQLNQAVSAINENYVDGTTTGNYLICPMQVIGVTAPNKCFGGNEGSIVLTVTGGVAPISYKWSNGATTKDIFNLFAGNYTVTVKDAANQQVIKSFAITQPASAISVIEDVKQLSCESAYDNSICDGEIHISVSGGVGPYQIVWSNELSGFDLEYLCEGEYNYTITDALGCQKSGTVTLVRPEPLYVSSACPSIIKCAGECTASIDITVYGGKSPYSYLWNDGVTTEDRDGLCSGQYSVIVTDSKGCTFEQIHAPFVDPAPLAVEFVNIVKPVCGSSVCSGAATASASGGHEPYSFAWSNGATTVTATNLCEDQVYFVTVTDANNCTAKFFVGIGCVPPPPCTPGKTYTQGGWGAPANGNNPGTYRDANFANAFPDGLTIGCDNYSLKLTSALDVRKFLPSGTTPAVLDNNYINPGTSYSNVLAGQLVAITLSVGFDMYDANFSSSDESLINYIYNGSGPLSGYTVGNILYEANQLIGGCSSAFEPSYVNDVLDNLNRNFDNGNTDLGYLDCPMQGENMRLDESIATSSFGLYPNPANAVVTLTVHAKREQIITVRVVNMLGQVMSQNTSNVTAGNNTINFNGINQLVDGVYSVQVMIDGKTLNQNLMIKK